MMAIDVKICGLKTFEAVDASSTGGAVMCGFCFYPYSPRFLEVEFAKKLTSRITKSVKKVGLVVDAEDSWLQQVATTGIDWWQFHGKEAPDRVAQVKERFGFPIIKAFGISNKLDLKLAREYEEVADLLLFDAKPPKSATRPGGNARTFNWEVIQGEQWKCPWAIAGGLNISNLNSAINVSGARMVDVSSGVEDGTGEKSSKKIREFLTTAKSL
ncbi:MAG: N-(5'-phosphoribosyl)anthranilate isomerase [Alphaproteobacteria bacterium MarineAlpha3_Bin5]|nr:phosphoribosylanthranilate isomerase [Magnetovibrio sp.]PPR77504.1 MAG: N-(5'-phosphoribosyl)anthranilate isomerase [Alphaproteobacteria bacterium MarineAlpha3_Bin5]